jgi:hypothetical protein
MEVQVNWKISAVYNGTAWHITINGDKVGPAIKSDATIKLLIAWLHEAREDIAAVLSKELEK